ncbi:MAG: TolC family protein [Verrucomicrobia bacterium]|nr:TolC family protein [Verrucomicrobiota bacterium]
MKFQIVSLLLVISTTVGPTCASESRGTVDPLAESTTLFLDQVIPLVLKQNPMIRSAREKWRAARDRIPQAGAWDDLKIGTNVVFGRFVSVPANAFTDQSLSIEQMIPLSGKNRSKERVAAGQALAAFEEARRQELDVVAKAKATYYQISNLYQLLDINNADEASLVQSLVPRVRNLKLARSRKPISCWLTMSVRRSSKPAEILSESSRTASRL